MRKQPFSIPSMARDGPEAITAIDEYAALVSEGFLLSQARRTDMEKEVIGAIVRHGMTWIGGLLIARGVADPSTIGMFSTPEVIGAVTTVVGLGWSIWRKWARA